MLGGGGGLMLECCMTERRYQLECDKPLRRGKGLEWKFFLLHTLCISSWFVCFIIARKLVEVEQGASSYYARSGVFSVFSIFSYTLLLRVLFGQYPDVVCS